MRRAVRRTTGVALVVAGAIAGSGRAIPATVAPVTVSALGGAVPAAVAAPSVVSAVDTGDTTIRADHPDNLYGMTSRLYVRNTVTPANSIEALSYVEFGYDTGTRAIAGATLRLRATSNTRENVCVFRVPW